MFSLVTHRIHLTWHRLLFVISRKGVLCVIPLSGRKEGNVLFNNTLNTFLIRLYGVGYMVKDHSDSESENSLLPHGLLFPISNNGSFICTIPQAG